MPVVYEKKRVPENCSTCLYLSDGLFVMCGNVNVSQEQAIKYKAFGGCPHYCLNQHKYTREE